MTDVTHLLGRIDDGDDDASAELYQLVYDELRAMARRQMSREGPGRTLQATALVHEAYLKLVGQGEVGWENRRHFFKAVAENMRRILVDRARERGAAKRGGDWRRLSLDGAGLTIDEPPDGLLDLNDAIAALEREHPVRAELVKLRYFGGLGQVDAARALGLPPTTADRHWAFARAWLYRHLDARD